MPRKPKPDDASDAPTTGGNILRELGPRRCAADGTVLETGGRNEGWCPEGRGYAVAFEVEVVALVAGSDGRPRERKLVWASRTTCPFACPICGARLTWDGGCDACYGSRTPNDRTTWTFPGDRYQDFEEEIVPASPSGPRGPVPGIRYAPTEHYRLVARGPRRVANDAEVGQALAKLKAMLAAFDRRTVGAATPLELAAEGRDPGEPAWVREGA